MLAKDKAMNATEKYMYVGCAQGIYVFRSARVIDKRKSKLNTPNLNYN